MATQISIAELGSITVHDELVESYWSVLKCGSRPIDKLRVYGAFKGYRREQGVLN